MNNNMNNNQHNFGRQIGKFHNQLLSLTNSCSPHCPPQFQFMKTLTPKTTIVSYKLQLVLNNILAKSGKIM